MIGEMLSGNLWLLLLVQATLCIAVGLAASHILHSRAARAHQVLLTALAIAVLTPGAFVLVRYFRIGVLTSPLAPRSLQIIEPVASSSPPIMNAVVYDDPGPMTVPEPLVVIPSQDEPAAGRVDWVLICLGCWIATSAVLLSRLGLRFALGLRLLRAAHPVADERLCRALKSAATRLEITRPIQVRRSERIRSPIIWCWTRRPALLVHAQAVEDSKDADWVGIFCHELAHLKRRDHVSGLFAGTLTALLPWHPLLWWATARLAKLSEQACDDWVLAAGQNGVDYAETLLGLSAQRQMAFVPTVVGKERTMKTRICRIIKDRCGNPKVGARWAASVSLLAVLAVVTVGFAQRRPAEQEERAIEVVTEQPAPQQPREGAPDWQRRVLERKLDELAGQIREKEMMLRQAGDMPPEERRVQEFELDLLREMTGQVERRLRTLTQREPRMAPDPQVERQPLIALKEEMENLVATRNRTRRGLDALRDGQDKEADTLREQLVRIETRQRVLEKAIADQERAREEPERESTRLRQESPSTNRRRTVAPDPYGGTMYDGMGVEEPRERVTQSRRGPRQTPAGPDRDGLETRVYAIQHGDAERIRDIVEAMTEKPETVTVYGDGRRLAVYATHENHLRIEGILKGLDVPRASPGRQEPGDRVTTIYRLRHANLQRIRDAIQSVLDGSGQVSVDGRTNSVIVSTTREKREPIETLVRELDVPTDAPDLKKEVDDLRGQMNGLREQLQQMQRLLEQVAERRQPTAAPTQPSGTQELRLR